MSDLLIVSRHTAAVEFIRAEAAEFASAPVLESATADDVRGKIVAGNLPLHLACLARQVVVVESPPRGTENGITEMRTAGAKLARYTVQAITPPTKEIDYSDGLLHRGRHQQLIVGNGNIIAQFEGKPIPGVVAIVRSDYNKNGKWSNTKYRLRFAADAWHYVAMQSWEESEYFHGCNSVGDVVVLLTKAGATTPARIIVAFLREKFQKTCERLDAIDKSLASI